MCGSLCMRISGLFHLCFMMFRPFHYVSCLRLWACALCDVSCCFIFRRSAIVGVDKTIVAVLQKRLTRVRYAFYVMFQAKI